jgi:hypothetical protein
MGVASVLDTQRVGRCSFLWAVRQRESRLSDGYMSPPSVGRKACLDLIVADPRCRSFVFPFRRSGTIARSAKITPHRDDKCLRGCHTRGVSTEQDYKGSF